MGVHGMLRSDRGATAYLRRLLAITLVVSLFAQLGGLAGAATPPEPTVRVPGHVLAALETATVLPPSPAASAEPLTLTVVLARSDQAGFERYLRDAYDPGSTTSRRFLGPQDLSARFGPSQQSYDAVRAWLESQGFTVVQGSANRLTLAVKGTRQQAERAFRISIGNYRIGQRSFYANDRDPSVPAHVARDVQAIVGLSSLAAPAAPLVDKQRVFDNICRPKNFKLEVPEEGLGLFGVLLLTWLVVKFELLKAVEAPLLLSGIVICTGLYAGLNLHESLWGTGESPFTPSLAAALPTSNAQKIGLLEFDTFRVSDIQDWLSLIHADQGFASRIQVIPVNGGVSTPGPNESEVLLDIATAMLFDPSPNTTYAVYTAPSSASFQQLFNAMINDGVTVISNSWSQCEDQTSLAEAQSIDSVLAQAAAQGISVLNGSGDSGSTCLDGSPNTIGVPANSPRATAVGGTTPTFGPGFTYGGETVWSGGTQVPPSGQSGFGVSRYFSRPNYQNGLNASAMRSIPDVVVPADPKAGIMLCQASAGGCPTGLMYGGTSMAAPAMAGMVAFLNERLGSNIGEVNPVLYPLAGTRAFHSPASMGSDFAHAGLGSPSLDYIKLALLHQSIGPVDVSASRVVSSRDVPADGVTTGIVQVNLVDANGYPVSGKTVTLTPSAGSHAVVKAVSGTSDVDSGAVVFQFANTTIETVTFTATTDGVALPETVTLKFVTPSAAAGGISAAPGSVPADGHTATTITVTLQDDKGLGSPGKVVTLSQGAGHSLIVGPSPAVTDANGHIQFTATNTVSETVTYTAIDVTDGNLAIPGSASVTFTGQSSSCVGAPPTAANGFALSAFANGFLAQNFFFSGVNWGGCPGASNPAFATDGSVFVTDFANGNLYKLGAGGGAVSTANTLGTLGLALGQPVFGKDGKLYVSRGATGAGVSSGDVLQIDPATGAVLKTVATGLTCAGPLAVDPLSGDLFLSDTCFGFGQSAQLFRIQNPGGASPALSTYATLPSSPNGAIAFAPNGTLYVSVAYNGAGNIVQVGGTNTPSPPAMTTLSNISTDFWITIAETQSGGAAKSLLVHSGGVLRLVDISTAPFTSTPLINGTTISSGTVGPDGCLYASSSDTLYKLTSSDGRCGFTPSTLAATLSLSPASVSPNPAQGTPTTFTATLHNVPQPEGTPITFAVDGANPQIKLVRADSSGQATFQYTGISTGTDTVTAVAAVATTRVVANRAAVTWNGGQHVTFVGLNQTATSGSFGQPVTLKASLADLSSNPTAAIPGAVIVFTIGGEQCAALTDAAGTASCALTPSASGRLTLTATFPGSAQYSAATSSTGFLSFGTSAPTPPRTPTITSATSGNGQATIAFEPPASDGGSAITGYRVACTPAGGGSTVTATGAGSPITVFGLTSGLTYSCTVSAINSVGTGASTVVCFTELSGVPSAAIQTQDDSVVGAQTIPLASAVLPGSRSVAVGCPATAFATVINAGASLATGVGIAPLTNIPATFNYQTTDPLTNAVVGAANTPADIAPGAAQTFVIAITPIAPFAPTDVALSFSGANSAAASLIGINTLLLSASAAPVADVIALAATLNNDGIVNIPGPSGTGVFAVATVNVAVNDVITVSADTGSGHPPVTIALCQTDPTTGLCVSALGSIVTTQIKSGQTPTFAIFVQGTGTPVVFDPANNRVFIRFKNAEGVTRGSTSVAVRTQ